MSVRKLGLSFLFSKNTRDECVENRMLGIPHNCSSSGSDRDKKSVF